MARKPIPKWEDVVADHLAKLSQKASPQAEPSGQQIELFSPQAEPSGQQIELFSGIPSHQKVGLQALVQPRTSPGESPSVEGALAYANIQKGTQQHDLLAAAATTNPDAILSQDIDHSDLEKPLHDAETPPGGSSQTKGRPQNQGSSVSPESSPLHVPSVTHDIPSAMPDIPSVMPDIPSVKHDIPSVTPDIPSVTQNIPSAMPQSNASPAPLPATWQEYMLADSKFEGMGNPSVFNSIGPGWLSIGQNSVVSSDDDLQKQYEKHLLNKKPDAEERSTPDSKVEPDISSAKQDIPSVQPDIPSARQPDFQSAPVEDSDQAESIYAEQQEQSQASRLPPGGRPSSPVAPPVQDAIPEVGQNVIKGIADPGLGEISSTLWGVPDAAVAGGAGTAVAGGAKAVAAGGVEAAGAAAAGGATAAAAGGVAAGAAEGAALGSVVPGAGTILGSVAGAVAAAGVATPSPVPGSANAGAAASFRDLGSAAGYAFGSAGGPLGSSVGMTIGGLAGKWLGGGEVTGAEISKSALSIAGGSVGGKAGSAIGSALGGLFGGEESGGGSGGGGGVTTISGSSDGDSSLMNRLLREISINIRTMVNDGIVIRGDHRQGGSKM